MAQAPMAAPASGGMMGGGDPMAGADAGGPAPDDSGAGGTVLVTICDNGDGSYTVYDGPGPDDDADAGADAGAAPGGDMGGDMGGGMGGGGGGGGGQPADSIGAALKLAMDIMQTAKSSEGMPGNADDQMAAGYAADKSPTPARGLAQKY